MDRWYFLLKNTPIYDCVSARNKIKCLNVIGLGTRNKINFQNIIFLIGWGKKIAHWWKSETKDQDLIA